MPKKYLANLNKQQRRAVRHGSNSKKPDSRPLLVLAGAGTGKTELITYRFVRVALMQSVQVQKSYYRSRA